MPLFSYFVSNLYRAANVALLATSLIALDAFSVLSSTLLLSRISKQHRHSLDLEEVFSVVASMGCGASNEDQRSTRDSPPQSSGKYTSSSTTQREASPKDSPRRRLGQREPEPDPPTITIQEPTPKEKKPPAYEVDDARLSPPLDDLEPPPRRSFTMPPKYPTESSEDTSSTTTG